MKNLTKKGFTLVELIIVVAIIGLLAAATFVAINPAKRIGDANNAQRWADITAIADAFMAYTADNNGNFVTGSYTGTGDMENTTFMIATTTPDNQISSSHCTATTTDEEFIDLSGLVSGGYVGKIPTDPTWTYANENDHTQYYLYYDADSGAVTFGACETYDSEVINLVR